MLKWSKKNIMVLSFIAKRMGVVFIRAIKTSAIILLLATFYAKSFELCHHSLQFTVIHSVILPAKTLAHSFPLSLSPPSLPSLLPPSNTVDMLTFYDGINQILHSLLVLMHVPCIRARLRECLSYYFQLSSDGRKTFWQFSISFVLLSIQTAFPFTPSNVSPIF